MRKLIVFLAFMNFLLLGGGQYLNAGTHDNSHHIEKRHRIKFTSQERTASIIEDADINTDEEHFGNDDLNDALAVKFFAARYSILDDLYLAFSSQEAVNSYSLFEILGPSCGQSNPIYITQRVLRI